MYKPEIEIADVFRAFKPAFQKRYGDSMLPSHSKAINDITACMTEDMGGHRHRCNNCDKDFWAYHGCRNRSCPKCHGRQIAQWLKKRSVELLPCQYFHVVATVPSELRPLFLAHQKDMYGLLMKVAATAIIELAQDKKYLGATPGILSVLHTWSSKLQYHPHVHMIVTGGGLENDETWRELPSSFLVPVKKLSPLICKRFKEELQSKWPDLFEQIDPKIWKKAWCTFADCKSVGEGQDALIKYLARYVFRIAITSGRIDQQTKTHVTFKYKENSTGKWKKQCIPGVEFMRRYLLHVLPKGFHKVRYFGIWSSGKKARLRLLAKELQLLQTTHQPVVTLADIAEKALTQSEIESHDYIPKCPYCGSTDVTHLQSLRRRWRNYVT